MADQQAQQDRNQFPALIAHSGTAGTAETVRVVASSEGALRVVTNETEATGFEGGTVYIGTTAVELTFTGTTQAILITSDSGNTAPIYIGGSVVASDGSAAITRLDGGDSLSIDINDGAAPLYAVSSAASQKVYKVALI
jgi:hypothetical protein